MMLKFVALSAGLISGANAFWRMECPGRLGVARMDPIMNPGTASGHAHSLHGSSELSESSDTSDLMGGNCTSCRVTQDKSGYWHPSLYFQDASTGKYEIVPQVGGMLAYYLLYGDNITAFPPGFKMISGDNDRRTYTVGDPSQPDPPKSNWASLGQTTQGDLAQRAIGFNCLNYNKNPEGTLYRHYLPDKAYLDANCIDGVRFELMFPSCWGGSALDSANHRDHVAFPDLVMTGDCPEGFPVRLPSMLFEVIWNTYAFKDRNGKFILSNGDTTGYSYHGDFVTGWDESFLQQAVNTCTNPSGRIEDCPLFNVVDEGTATSCQFQNPLPQVLLNEDVLGPMVSLPGQSPDNTNNDSSAPVLSYRPGEKPSEPAHPLPGQAFKEGPPGAAAQAVEPSTTLAPTIPSTPEPSYYSTQYITEGNIVTKILWIEQDVYVTEYVDSSAAAATPAAGVQNLRRGMRHAHLHGKV